MSDLLIIIGRAPRTRPASHWPPSSASGANARAREPTPQRSASEFEGIPHVQSSAKVY